MCTAQTKTAFTIRRRQGLFGNISINLRQLVGQVVGAHDNYTARTGSHILSPCQAASVNERAPAMGGLISPLPLYIKRLPWPSFKQISSLGAEISCSLLILPVGSSGSISPSPRTGLTSTSFPDSGDSLVPLVFSTQHQTKWGHCINMQG